MGCIAGVVFALLVRKHDEKKAQLTLIATLDLRSSRLISNVGQRKTTSP